MSVLEELHGIEDRLVARLDELEPLVREYEELQRVAERLGIERSAAKPARTVAKPRSAKRKASPKRSGGSGRRRSGGTQATGRERRDKVLGLIRERPGITVRELSEATGVDAPSLYRVVRRLQSDGAVTKDGKQLRA